MFILIEGILSYDCLLTGFTELVKMAWKNRVGTLAVCSSLHQNNKLFLVHDKLCLVSHWPPASEIGMLLVTTFVELRVVAGRSRKRAGSPQAVFRRPMLIHTCHAVPMPCCAVALRSRFQNGMVGARHGHDMDTAWAWNGKRESDTAALCKSSGKDMF